MKEILIVDGDTEICGSLQRELVKTFDVTVCNSGIEAFCLLGHRVFDCIVLEPVLPELDGITLLSRLNMASIRPRVLVTTSFVSDYLLEALEQFDVAYLVRKPYSAEGLRLRLEEITQLQRTEYQGPKQDPVTTLLLSLGFLPGKAGFSCVREGLAMVAKYPQISLTKELYPALGEMVGGSGEKVEKQIRKSIEKAWEEGDTALWRHYFPKHERRPSNHAFFARMAEELPPSYRNSSSLAQEII